MHGSVVAGAGRLDTSALRQSQRPQRRRADADQPRRSADVQDEERAQSSAHGRPGRPRRLRRVAAASRGAHRRRHRRKSRHLHCPASHTPIRAKAVVPCQNKIILKNFSVLF